MNRHVTPRIFSAREFNQHTGRAKQAADEGPVIITERGKPAYVLMTSAEFELLKQQRTTGSFMSLLDALQQEGGAEYDYEIELPPRVPEPFRNPFDTSET